MSPGRTRRLTCLDEQTWFALLIPDRESLDNSIDLLCFARKRHVHEKLAQSDVERVVFEVEAGHVDPESFRAEIIGTEGRQWGVPQISLTSP